ncbi:NPC intracellular cholesterol transporter 2-like [Argopecten irradians]|uniref:NPC intracellular cholesterol transporter 2-like n=1 Tax=Argopecten irradians TaxID=31199 RepID=UPI00371E1F1B
MSVLEIFVLCIFCICFAATSPVKDCVNKATTAKNVTVVVGDCDMTGSTCTLKRGTNASVTVTFTAESEDHKAVAKVEGLIAGIPIPFNVGHSDGCAYAKSGLSCPMVKTKVYTYRHLVPVLNSYPKISLTVVWNLIGDSESIFCFAMGAQISD